MVVDLNKAYEVENGIKVGGVVLPDSVVGPVRSSKPTFASGLITDIDFFNSLTQVTANRIARSEFTYSGDAIISQINRYYGADGTTVVSTETISYTYTGDEITKIEVS